jgi:AraC family transcriptional regulator
MAAARPPGEAAVRQRRILRGQHHINGAEEAPWQRWREPVDVLVVAFAPAFFTCIATELALGSLDVATAIGVRDRSLSDLTGLCLRELDSNGASGGLYLDSLGAALAVRLLHRYGRAGVARRKIFRGGLAPRALRRVIDHIENHLAADLHLTELAEIAGVSVNYFARAFRDSTQQTPHGYVIARRIARAQVLLADGDLPIAEIALAVGFSNQSHFTEHFRRLTGTTPARFQRDH